MSRYTPSFLYHHPVFVRVDDKMSATRASSTRALRQLSSHSHQVRHLHMTPPATFPAQALTTEKNVLPSLPRDLSGLRAECARRGVSSAGSKDEVSCSTSILQTASNSSTIAYCSPHIACGPNFPHRCSLQTFITSRHGASCPAPDSTSHQHIPRPQEAQRHQHHGFCLSSL